MTLLAALEDRRKRATEVRETYEIEYIGSCAWLVRHPTEDDRFYLVDMANRTCDCPDFNCRPDSTVVECKHLIAVDPIWRKMTGRHEAALLHRGRPIDASDIPTVKDPGSGEPEYRTDERGKRIALTAEEIEAARVDPFAD